MTHASYRFAFVLTLAVIAGCTIPIRRDADTTSSVPAGDTPTGDALAAECAELRTEIRTNQQNRLQAPATSVTPQIVDAAQAKADKNIYDLQQQYDELGCPDQPKDNGRQPIIPAAPGGPLPGGR